MSFTLKSIFLVILFCVSACGTRKNLLSIETRHTISALTQFTNDDGICTLMVNKQGYACEEHTVISFSFILLFILPNRIWNYQMIRVWWLFCYQVITQDGYILSMQRIPVGVSGKKANGIPVLLQHGLFMVVYLVQVLIVSSKW